VSRAQGLVSQAVSQGAELALDGGEALRGLPARLAGGSWMGPTVLTGVTQSSPAYREELFAPVLVCLQAADLGEALAIVNASKYGNGGAIFTQSGAAARHFAHHVQCGQVGVNVPIPVALPAFSFSGWKASFNGSLHFYGRQGVEFFTKTKTVTSNWRMADAARGKRASTSFPTSKAGLA
jgi:malonate-semialdehyde dehydrogenase (acetylating)/methylmalonate-semialdehyde dehydrogenase